MATRKRFLLAFILLLAGMISACNLSGAPSEEQIAQTSTAEITLPPTWTPASNGGIPTTMPVTQPTFEFPTSVILAPTSILPQIVLTTPPQPVSILILSPSPGNLIAGNVQILGSASHPQFLQYQVEYGPDPNPGNLWLPATPAVTTPILNGLLGIWNTQSIPDGHYQLRLRVYLRDGTLLTTVVNNITVQNHINTPVPSATPNTPRPIAAFTQDKASGNVPLTVQFTNQSNGTINTVSWNFGDGTTSSETNPTHTFGTPGLYNVTLTVNGPGGTANVARQINVTSATAPVAGFTQDRTSGVAPLTVQFSDQSTGSVSTYLWSFSDGTTSTDKNPQHVFNTPGTYNVFLTVGGPGGSSSVTRQIAVTSAVPATATPSPTVTPLPSATPTSAPALRASFTSTGVANDPLSIQFTSTSTGNISSYLWNFGDGGSDTSPTPLHTYASSNTYTVTLMITDASGQTATANASVTVTAAIHAGFTFTVNGLSAQFSSQSAGPIASYFWDFGDGQTSTDQNPSHTYGADGSYTVKLTVSDSQGRQDSASNQVTVHTPLKAQFTAQVSGLSVQFTNQSVGQIASYAWEFGDGQTSGDQNPTHVYGAGGSYTVILTITGSDGSTAQTSQQIGVSIPVKAQFSATPNGLSVQFTDQSVGQIAAYAWGFGDGGTATDQNPAHTYAAGGNYTVKLTVTGSDGSTDSTSQKISVSAPLNAQFSAAPNGLTVQFTDQSSGPISAYAWDFGDGGTATDQNPAHTYAAGGSYTVTLTISDASGNQANTQQQITLQAPLVAQFSAAPNGLTVQFTDQSTGPVAAYAWDFGDGQTSNQQNPSHTYAAGGTYTVTLTIADANATTANTQQQVTVSAPLVAQFSAAPNGLSVQFTDQSSGPISAYAWDFGDGQTSNQQNPSHTYAAGGSYTVTLTIADANAVTANTQQQVTVSAPLNAQFTAQVNGLSVQFTDQSTGTITTYAWDFGDGQTSNQQNPSHTYTAGGSYTVTLTIGDASGNQANTQQQVTVSAPLTAQFSATPNGLTVQFTDQSSGSISAYAWNFGDGGTATDQNPTHTYPADGTYTVTLTISDASGNQANTQQSITVTSPLTAQFSAVPNGLTVQFTDQSTGTIASFAWDFGDGGTATDENPTHSYASASTYTVTLTISDASGKTTSAQQQVTVTSPLTAQFSAAPNGLDVQFTDQSTGNISSYAWDFGDGGTSSDQNPTHTYGAGGTYTVGLTVTDASGLSANTSQSVTVTAPPAITSIVDSTPIQPDLKSLKDALTTIYQGGVNAGNQAHVFGLVGDGSVFTNSGILAPFAMTGQYDLKNHSDLQAIIDWFNSPTSSFNQTSPAVNQDWTAQDLLDATKSDPNVCQSGETPLACELRLTHPVLMFISVGLNDARNSGDASGFNGTLTQIVNTISASGTIPVLLTIPDDGSTRSILTFNEAIINVAQITHVPLINAARATEQTGLTTAPSGPGNLGDNATSSYGVNALNLDLLQVLNDMRTLIFPGAS